MKRNFVDCGETIKLKRIKEDMNIEDSVDGPLNIQHNEELLFINLIGSDPKDNGNKFGRNIFILNYYFLFLYFSIIFYLDNLTKVNVILIMLLPVVVTWGF